MPTQEEGLEMLGGLCTQLTDQLQVLAPDLGFAGIFWNRGAPEDRLGMGLFAQANLRPEAPYAAITAARATQGAASGLELHGLDTPDRVCFYEQDFYVLSNFSAFPIRWRGIPFATVEHAYHWERFGDGEIDILVPGAANPNSVQGRIAARDFLRQPMTSAHEAFRLAQMHKNLQRPDWDDIKIGVMQMLIFAKCDQHEYVKRKLLQTGDRLLVENSWRDSFWGWGPDRTGENMLGRLWMLRRAFYREQGAKAAEDAGSRL